MLDLLSMNSLVVLVLGLFHIGDTCHSDILLLVVSIEQLGDLFEGKDTVLALGFDNVEVEEDKLEHEPNGAFVSIGIDQKRPMTH